MPILKWYELQSWRDFKAHLATHRNEYMPDERRQACLAVDIDMVSNLINRVLEENGDKETG